MSSTRAALRRNEAKSMQSSSSSSSSANVRSGSIPSIRGAGSFQNAGPGPRPGPGANQVALRAATNQMTQGNPNAMRMQQQQQYAQFSSQNVKNEPKKKLTIEQAITLITLRLGRLEVSMQEIEGNENGTGSGGGMNADLAQNILERLDALEEESAGTSHSNVSGSIEYATKSEVSLLSQKLDALKTVVSKSASASKKSASASASSPATETALNNLRNEVKELRDTLKSIETMVFGHDSQIMLLNMNAEANAIDDDAVLDDADADTEENVHIPDTSPTVIVEDEPESENDDIDE